MSGDGPVSLSPVDQDLIACLQLSPRAGHRQLGEALGLSVPTVSRRLTRLKRERVLQFTVEVPWWVRSETHPQHVWIDTAAGKAPQVAAAVADLPHAQYVAVTAGRSDVYCILDTGSRAQMTALLTDQLPGIDGVVATRSELGLSPFATAAGWRLRRLAPAVEERLRPGDPLTAGRAVPTLLRDEERQVLGILQADGRASSADVARTLNISPSTAYRSLSSLFERQIAVPRVEVEPGLIGYPLEVVVALIAKPGAMTDLATTLADHPSTRYVATVAGHSSVLHHGVFAHENALADFLAHDVAALPGISGLEVSAVLDVVTRYWGRRERMLHAPA